MKVRDLIKGLQKMQSELGGDAEITEFENFRTVEKSRIANMFRFVSSMLKANLTIEEMEKLMRMLQNYVESEKSHMSRNT